MMINELNEMKWKKKTVSGLLCKNVMVDASSQLSGKKKMKKKSYLSMLWIERDLRMFQSCFYNTIK